MSDVKWIKISTSIFDDEKIMLIDSLPKADSILMIWFKLLSLAGKTNNGGVFLLTENVPYTNEMLSKIFRRKKALVDYALNIFLEYGMIEIIDGVITIPNWEKHQSLQAFDNKKEYMRKYMKEYRSKQNVKLTESNSKVKVSRIDKDKEEDKDKELDKNKKHTYGEYKHVKLTDAELDRLFNDYGEKESLEAIRFLDEYIQMKGYKAKDHNLALRKWVFNAVKEEQARNKPQGTSVFDAWANA